MSQEVFYPGDHAEMVEICLAESEPCLDCDEQGHYPSGAICKSCGGVCRVPKGTNGGVIAY